MDGWMNELCYNQRGARRDMGKGSKPAERQRQRARGHGDGPCLQVGNCHSILYDDGGRAQAQWLLYYLDGAPVVKTPAQRGSKHKHAT